MLRARRLFLSPVLAILIVGWLPVIGIPLALIWIVVWYVKKQSEIHRYFKNEMYEQHEISKELIDKDRFL